MPRTLRSDKVLLWVTFLLVGLSVVMVYSAKAGLGPEPTYEFPTRQLAWALLGLCGLFVAMRVDYTEYRRPAVIWSLLGVTTVLLLLVFLFDEINGTRRWIIVADLFSMQPSELAKLAAIVFAAALLERRMHRVNDPSYALKPLLIVTGGLVVLILAQPDFGTSVMLVAIVGAILFAAGLSYRFVLGGGLMLLPPAMLLVWLSPYRWRRMTAFLDPWSDARDSGYQIVQALIAIGSGGPAGLGLTQGVQKASFLPYPYTDFIFASLGEELGLIGTTAVLVCFLLIAWRGLRTALLAPDRFGSLMAIGLTTMIAVQGLVNMSVNLSLLPAKGIPLPFVSSGGSSLVVNMIAMGILLNISQRASASAASALEERG